MSAEQDEKAGARTVTEAEYLQNARAILRRAEAEGPITIVDHNGVPRMSIHRPRERVPASEE